MADIRKKVINIWDDGIKTSSRSSNPDIGEGSQMIKGFDVYKDPKKLVPMQSWEDFATEAEKRYNIVAMGGISDTVYGVGSAVKNWYGHQWQHRIRVDVNDAFHRSGSVLPLWLDMSLLPSDFWDNANADMSDVRITSSNHTAYGNHIENLDTDARTGDMWITPSTIDGGAPTFTSVYSSVGTGSNFNITHTASAYAFSNPVTLTGETFNMLTFNAFITGNPGSLIVDLYTDSAGSPGTLVTNLGTVTQGRMNTVAKDIEIYFSNLSYSGSYHIVYRCPTATASNYVVITYSSTGSTTLKAATNSGITTWSTVDAAATPNYTFSYFENLTNPDKYFYIYYGNPDATSVPYSGGGITYTQSGTSVFNSLACAYTFGDDKASNKAYSNSTAGDTEAFETDPKTYTNGLFGRAIATGNTQITTDSDDDVGPTGSDVSVSFMYKINQIGVETVIAFQEGQGGWDITILSTGAVRAVFDGVAGNTTRTSVRLLEPDVWHVIDVVFDSDLYIYIDGVKETWDNDDGSYDADDSVNSIQLNTGEYGQLAQAWVYGNDISDYQVQTKYYNFTHPSFWSVGSEESIGDINLEYSGVQVYTKDISDGDWKDLLSAGRVVKNLEYYPLNAFIDDVATYFMVSNTAGVGNGFIYLAKIDIETLLDTTHLPLGAYSVTGTKTTIQLETAIDNTGYFNNFTSVISSIGDPGVASEFTAVATVQSMEAWRTYLAIGSTRRNKGYIDIWDLASTVATERVNVGTGNLRIVGNASDTLFCVIDNFTDDAVKSGNKPTMEIRQYIGNGETETTHIIEVPAIITAYTSLWERAVSNFKISRNTQALFYARLPKDSTGETFNEGFWAVGKNRIGELCLTLQIDTEGLGMPMNVFGFAQQVFFIQKDGGIKRLSDDTYNNVALATTLKMNEGNTEIEKKLHGVEVITDPLDPEQVISVYYKIAGATERTKIGELTGTGAISKEMLYDADGNNLSNYKEVEFDVESTKGKAAIRELNYKYEYLGDII